MKKREAVTFETKTHRNAARFVILKHVRKQLGLSSQSGAVLYLVIRTRAGRILFAGTIEKKSGSEIYWREIRDSGHKAGQRITVTVSLA